jgi:hypothetical protein
MAIEGGQDMLGTRSARHAMAALPRLARTRWQLRVLGRAVRAGDSLGALVAAARIHAIAVRPSMRRGDWARAHAACERVLTCIPARGGPGYRPQLRRVTEYFLASAAAAARADGDLAHARRHLHDLVGCRNDRGAPPAELAHMHLTAGEAEVARRILAGARGHPD